MPDFSTIQKISFIGSGNLATNLALGLQKAGLRIVEVFSPDKSHARQFANLINCTVADHLESINTESDLYLIAVPDDAIEDVGRSLPQFNGIAAHTSGISSIKSLASAKNHGVFYPLQTFTLGRKVDLAHVPFFIEGSDNHVINALKVLAGKLSDNVREITSDQRRQLHLAAVFVSNFPNHLFSIAEDILEEQGLGFDFLKPLIRETAAKVSSVSPASAQTGPARRNDSNTLEKHLEMLEQYPEYRKLYQLISEQIKKKYHE